MSSKRNEVARAATALGFKFAGYDGSGHVVWKHPNGARHSTPASPSEYRGVRNAIAALERLAGLKLERPNHRRGRKSASGTDPEVEAARRKHAETFEAKRAEQERQAAQARAAAAAERRRREIEDLMRPGA